MKKLVLLLFVTSPLMASQSHCNDPMAKHYLSFWFSDDDRPNHAPYCSCTHKEHNSLTAAIKRANRELTWDETKKPQILRALNRQLKKHANLMNAPLCGKLRFAPALFHELNHGFYNDVLKAMLKNGANPNIAYPYSRNTILDGIAGNSTQTPLSVLMASDLLSGRECTERRVRLLLEHVKDINAGRYKNGQHLSPLAVVALRGNSRIANVLIEKGADKEQALRELTDPETDCFDIKKSQGSKRAIALLEGLK